MHSYVRKLLSKLLHLDSAEVWQTKQLSSSPFNLNYVSLVNTSFITCLAIRPLIFFYEFLIVFAAGFIVYRIHDRSTSGEATLRARGFGQFFGMWMRESQMSGRGSMHSSDTTDLLSQEAGETGQCQS